MAKEPEKRYQIASEVAETFEDKLAQIQNPGILQPQSKFYSWKKWSYVLLLCLIVLVFTENWGLTRLSAPVIQWFHHRLTVQLESWDTIVEIWMTDDKDGKNTKRTSLVSSGKLEPVATIVNTQEKTIALPPGNYWLLARLYCNMIERKHLIIGWGGSSVISIAGSNEIASLPDPPVAEQIAKLEELVHLAAEAKDVAEKRYHAGLIPHENVLVANIKWLEARLELALSRQNNIEASECLQKILTEQEARISFCQKQIAAGVIPESALISLQEDVVKTNQRIEKLKNKP